MRAREGLFGPVHLSGRMAVPIPIGVVVGLIALSWLLFGVAVAFIPPPVDGSTPQAS